MRSSATLYYDRQAQDNTFLLKSVCTGPSCNYRFLGECVLAEMQLHLSVVYTTNSCTNTEHY